jgi:hypothetical protein
LTHEMPQPPTSRTRANTSSYRGAPQIECARRIVNARSPDLCACKWKCSTGGEGAHRRISSSSQRRRAITSAHFAYYRQVVYQYVFSEALVLFTRWTAQTGHLKDFEDRQVSDCHYCNQAALATSSDSYRSQWTLTMVAAEVVSFSTFLFRSRRHRCSLQPDTSATVAIPEY